MSIETIARCNYCPKVRDPKRNHWWLITWHPLGRFTFAPWNDEAAGEADAHACSDECLKIAVSEHLSKVRDARATETT